MNSRQKHFCDEYIKTGNAAQAAVAAGYSEKTATYASAWINAESLKKPNSKFNPELREYIDAQLEALHNERTADAQEVLEYLTSVMRGESESEVTLVVGTGEGCSEPVTIKKRPDEKEKLNAADKLGKILGMYQNRLDVSGALPVVISGENDLDD